MIRITNANIKLKLDSGAEANFLTKQDFEKAVPKKQRQSKLKSGNAKLTASVGDITFRY